MIKRLILGDRHRQQVADDSWRLVLKLDRGDYDLIVGRHEHHAAVDEPEMGDFHGHAGEQDDLVAPVELVGFAQRGKQRHLGPRPPNLSSSPSSRRIGTRRRSRPPSRARAVPRISRRLFARRLAEIAADQEPADLVLPRSDLRLRLASRS